MDHLKLKLETNKNGRVEVKVVARETRAIGGPSGGPKGKVQIIAGDSQQEVAASIVMVVMRGANTSGGKTSKLNKQGKGSKGMQSKKPPPACFLCGGKAHHEKLPSMASSAGGDKEVGKRETWTPQSMMCGTQVNTEEVSPGDNTGPENEETFTELADQLRVQCPRETVVIPQRSK